MGPMHGGQPKGGESGGLTFDVFSGSRVRQVLTYLAAFSIGSAVGGVSAEAHSPLKHHVYAAQTQVNQDGYIKVPHDNTATTMAQAEASLIKDYDANIESLPSPPDDPANKKFIKKCVDGHESYPISYARGDIEAEIKADKFVVKLDLQNPCSDWVNQQLVIGWKVMCAKGQGFQEVDTSPGVISDQPSRLEYADWFEVDFDLGDSKCANSPDMKAIPIVHALDGSTFDPATMKIRHEKQKSLPVVSRAN